jgi:hypothetical protein
MAVDGNPQPKKRGPRLRGCVWVAFGIVAVMTIAVVRVIILANVDPPPEAAELADIALEPPERPKYYSYFRYNMIGRLLVILIDMRPAMQISSWQVDRCLPPPRSR